MGHIPTCNIRSNLTGNLIKVKHQDDAQNHAPKICCHFNIESSPKKERFSLSSQHLNCPKQQTRLDVFKCTILKTSNVATDNLEINQYVAHQNKMIGQFPICLEFSVDKSSLLPTYHFLNRYVKTANNYSKSQPTWPTN